MKRTMSKTPKVYSNSTWTYRNGPIENVSRDPRLRGMHSSQSVNVRRYNTIVNRRRLRLASYVPAPRLVKGFHNNPTVS
jgi:hypothetical protein